MPVSEEDRRAATSVQNALAFLFLLSFTLVYSRLFSFFSFSLFELKPLKLKKCWEKNSEKVCTFLEKRSKL